MNNKDRIRIYNKLILSAIFILTFSSSFSQEESFTNGYARFIIKERRLTSKVFADAVNKTKDSLPRGNWLPETTGKTNSVLPPPPAAPDVAVIDFKRFKHFIINPEYFIQFNTSYNTFDNETLSSEPRKIIRIKRNDLSVETFNTLNFTKREGKLYRMNICDYSIKEEFRAIKKTISGYSCFKVVLNHMVNTDYLIELYVTEDIKLNYHPIINCKEVINDYFPLYIKEYHRDYPDDKFNEYRFVKSR
jgi:hypothetical protein